MSGSDSGDEVPKTEAMSEDVVCVPAEFQESVLDDALELDAPESDDETAETSTNTVIFVPSGSTLSEDPDVNEASKPTSVNGATDPEQTAAIASKDKSAQNHHRRSSAKKKPSISGPNVDSKGSVSNRRRQWGSQSGDRTSSTVPSISSDTLEKLVPTLTSGSEQKPKAHTSSITSEAIASASDANLAENKNSDLGQDHDPDEMTNLTTATESETAEVDSSSVSRGGSSAPSAIQQRSSTTSSSKNANATNVTGHSKPASTKRKGPKETKAVGYLIEPPERIEPCTPAKHRPTDIVHIRSLVRPFTADQLRQMIAERFGPVLDLWLDRIKSSSLVRLESVQVATRCREGLDGCRWPSMNPNALHCDFGNDELFAWMKEHGNSGENIPPKHLVLGEKPSKTDETVGSTSVTEVGGRKKPDADAKGHQDTKPVDSRQGKTERSKESSKPTPKDVVGKEAPESKRRCEGPAKLLDDLFRKTTCTPCIYWLPLTDEQAKKQAVERAKLLQTNPPTTARPMGRPFVHGPTGPKQRATRSPFTSPVGTEQLAATHASNRSSSGPRSNGSRMHLTHEVESKDKRDITDRVEPSPLSASHARKRSRSPNTRRKRSQSSVSPPRVALQARMGSKTHDRRSTPTINRSGRPVAKRRDPTPPSPPRPRVVRRSTSSRSRSRTSLSSPSSRSSSSRSHSRNRGNLRRGKVPYRGSGRPRSRSFGRRSSPARPRR